MFSLGPSGLEEIFPTHFWIDSESRIVSIAPVLSKILPMIQVGDSMGDHFQLERPSLKTFDFKLLKKYAGSKILLQSKGRDEIRLDGQFVYVDDEGNESSVFVGRPATNKMSDLLDFSIPGNAYGIQDHYLDAVMTIERELDMRRELAQRAEGLRYESLVGIFARQIWDSPDLESLYRRITEVGIELLQLQDLVVYRAEGDQLIQASVSGKQTGSNYEHDPLTLRSGQGIVGRSFATGKPIYIADIRKDAEYVIDDFPGLSEFAVPMMHREQCYGVLDSESTAVDGYSEVTRETMEKFARIAAAAICHYRQALEIHQSIVERAIRLESRDLVLRASAHEVRTPLAQIASTVAVLQRAAHDQPRKDIYSQLEALDEPIQRLERFALAMLEQTNAENSSSSESESHWNRFHLCKYVQQLATATARTFGRHGDLKVKIPNTLVTIESDAESIAQIVSNLLSNAFKYSTTGSPVSLQLREEANSYVLEIEDQGIGIPAKLIGTIFEPFMRHPAAVSMASGTGLGLSIARERTTKIGGQLSLSSVVGEGTTFILVLPKKFIR
ncbi:MAG: ATP-binding protein [Planctomycetes bacterium]|nr:ATP-binding protein [Planctomycetota bacterium]